MMIDFPWRFLAAIVAVSMLAALVLVMADLLPWWALLLAPFGGIAVTFMAMGVFILLLYAVTGGI